jgi:DNA-binding response OmpR family regulator
VAKILVVEDDPKTARAMQLALQTEGHEVLTAGSKEEGEATAVGSKPDLMIVDVMMPEGTEGFHLVWKIRQMEDEVLKNVPIVMATGIHGTTEMRFYPEQTDGTYQPGEFLPVQGWIDKPIKVEDLLSKVEAILRA